MFELCFMIFMITNVWSMLGKYFVDTWPTYAWQMLGLESHTRDLGMNSHLFWSHLEVFETVSAMAYPLLTISTLRNERSILVEIIIP